MGPAQCELRLGTTVTRQGERVGFLRVGTTALEIDADTAESLSADLMRMALELRNGGALG